VVNTASPIPVQRDLNGADQLRRFEWLEQKGHGPGALGAGQGIPIVVGRQVNHRQSEIPAKTIRSLDSIRLPLDSDVHQYQVGARSGSLPDGVLHRRGDAGDLEAAVFETALDVCCHNALILYDENAAAVSSSRRCLVRL
jgi:hypothetical protein